MRQIHLPLFPIGSTQITSSLSFTHEGGRVTYFYGSLPVFSAPVLEAAQRGLDEGTPVSEVAISLGIKPDTLAKAVNAGKLRKPTSKKKTPRT